MEGSRWSVYNKVVSILQVGFTLQSTITNASCKALTSQLHEKVSTVAQKIRKDSKKKTKSPVLDELDIAHRALVEPLRGILSKFEELINEDKKLDTMVTKGLIEVSPHTFRGFNIGTRLTG